MKMMAVTKKSASSLIRDPMVPEAGLAKTLTLPLQAELTKKNSKKCNKK
jgi:hypothetical protein